MTLFHLYIVRLTLFCAHEHSINNTLRLLQIHYPTQKLLSRFRSPVSVCGFLVWFLSEMLMKKLRLPQAPMLLKHTQAKKL